METNKLINKCIKCGDPNHETNKCTLKIRIPYHVKISWTCPYCDDYFVSATPSIVHESDCNNRWV